MFLLIACNELERHKTFDLLNPKDFVVSKYKQQCKRLTKSVEINQIIHTEIYTDTSIFHTMDFINEIDLSKPTFLNALTVDSTIISDSTIIHIKCSESSNDFKDATFVRKGRVYTLKSVSLSTDNLITKTRKEINFLNDECYTITGSQKVDFIWSQDIRYKIIYVCN